MTEYAVVIDTSDRTQVERLLRLFWANGTDDGDDTAAMTAALRAMSEGVA